MDSWGVGSGPKMENMKLIPVEGGAGSLDMTVKHSYDDYNICWHLQFLHIFSHKVYFNTLVFSGNFVKLLNLEQSELPYITLVMKAADDLLLSSM